MIPVKICGVTNLKDAQVAVNSGASALGFIFYKKSPRFIQRVMAKKIAAEVGEKVALVGVFVDESLDYVHEVAEDVGLSIIQLHGNESHQYCKKVQLPIIKVFRVFSGFNVEILKNYDVHAFLFDTYEKNKPGGTGTVFNWDMLADLHQDTPIILSGGLNINNILDGIKIVCPSAVDINSGVELNPGIKDKQKINSLCAILKNTQSACNPFIISKSKRWNELQTTR